MPKTQTLYQELGAILLRHTARDRLCECAVPGLRLMHWSARSLPAYASRICCFALLVQGAKSLTIGDSEVRYGAGQYLLASVDLPATSRVTQASPDAPLLGLAVDIDVDALRQVMQRTDPSAKLGLGLGRSGGRSGNAGPAVAVHEAGGPLLEATARLVRLLDHPEHIAGLAPLAMQEIFYWLLHGPSGARLLEIARHDGQGNRIAQAMASLRERFDMPLSVPALAQEVGMSASSFHQHFKALSHMTPLQYQKHLRLQEARRMLLADDTGVGEASFRVGYQCASQFSKDYRRYFGAAPREDVEALRKAAQRAGLEKPSADHYLPETARI